jgi:hypothetical protein
LGDGIFINFIINYVGERTYQLRKFRSLTHIQILCSIYRILTVMSNCPVSHKTNEKCISRKIFILMSSAAFVRCILLSDTDLETFMGNVLRNAFIFSCKVFLICG